MHGRWWWGVAAVLVVLGIAAPAQAGTYRVWTCRGPDGKPTPTRDASYGWLPNLRAATSFMFLIDHCGDGGGIYAHLGGTPDVGDGGFWAYTPPPNTTIGGYNLTWSGTVTGGGEGTLARSDDVDPNYLDRNGAPFGPDTFTAASTDLSSLAAIAACSFTTSTCAADPVDFTITRAVMTLNDFKAPEATEVSGDLVGGGPLRGTMSVSFAGSDAGGGLYRVVVTVDGGDVAAGAVPDAAGRCVPVEWPYGFKWPQPCPLSVRATVPVDVSGLPEGAHSVGVYLEDAAGNRTALAGPVQRDVIRRGAVNGANGGDGAAIKRTGRYRVTTTFHGRRPLLRGTLTRAGAPVADAVLDVLAQNRNTGGQLHKIGEARTDAQGRYRVRAPAGPSRLLRVAYRAYSADAGYVAQTDVNHRVHASVALSARTRHVSLRGTARFSGRVRGGFVPPRGKLIELQAYDAGRWRTFATLRTGRSGRFIARYSFKRVTSARSYRFRARARYEPGYPFLLGVSPAVRVGVG
jgi:hypothetical protein